GHDCQDDTGREVLDAAGQGERAGAHVMGRDLVAHVDDDRVGGERPEDALHHTHELVGMAVVAEERDRLEATHHGPATICGWAGAPKSAAAPWTHRGGLTCLCYSAVVVAERVVLHDRVAHGRRTRVLH